MCEKMLIILKKESKPEQRALYFSAGVEGLSSQRTRVKKITKKIKLPHFVSFMSLLKRMMF